MKIDALGVVTVEILVLFIGQEERSSRKSAKLWTKGSACERTRSESGNETMASG